MKYLLTATLSLALSGLALAQSHSEFNGQGYDYYDNNDGSGW
jgi:hypothetical protein